MKQEIIDLYGLIKTGHQFGNSMQSGILFYEMPVPKKNTTIWIAANCDINGEHGKDYAVFARNDTHRRKCIVTEQFLTCVRPEIVIAFILEIKEFEQQKTNQYESNLTMATLGHVSCNRP